LEQFPTWHGLERPLRLVGLVLLQLAGPKKLPVVAAERGEQLVVVEPKGRLAAVEAAVAVEEPEADFEPSRKFLFFGSKSFIFGFSPKKRLNATEK